MTTVSQAAGAETATGVREDHWRPDIARRDDGSPAGSVRATRMRAVRGAISVAGDDPALILDATRELLGTLMSRNALRVEDIVSAIFTATPDLTSAFPARAAREMGWADVPLLCAVEIDVPGALPRCLRVLLHVERAVAAAPLMAAYLRDAVVLRPECGNQRGVAS